jgi:hypothetical protein
VVFAEAVDARWPAAAASIRVQRLGHRPPDQALSRHPRRRSSLVGHSAHQ